MARKTTAQVETHIPREMELVDLGGKLAILHLSYTDNSTPSYHQTYWVSPAESDAFTNILGQVVWSPGGYGYGQVSNGFGGHMDVNYRDWEYRTVETPIEKPRDKAENTWEWNDGQWRVKWFPACPECRKAHNPEWYDHCDWCGKAMSHGTRCPACKRNHSDN